MRTDDGVTNWIIVIFLDEREQPSKQCSNTQGSSSVLLFVLSMDFGIVFSLRFLYRMRTSLITPMPFYCNKFTYSEFYIEEVSNYMNIVMFQA